MFSGIKIQIWSYLYKNVTNSEKICFKVKNNFFYRSLKKRECHSKATLEDFLTLKKTKLVQFLRKCIEQVSGNKNELALRQRCRDVSFKKPVR
jgi:hypothetical protein